MEIPRLDRYEVISELGRGAMGVVYKARDTVLDRVVAIKAVDMSLERDGMANYEARFYQEARAAGSLNHPGIVTIYDIGKSGNIAFMAMEFIEGQELRAMLAEGRPLPVTDAMSLAVQVAEALAFAHERGIVHRDIKPANIMVVQGKTAKITDFGIARMRAATDLTQTGMMLGSPKYMSPEQALGKRAEPRSDMFSLGVILYEMLTGHPPFVGETVAAIMYQIVNFVPPAPSVLNKALPRTLDAVVASMLAKPLEGRFAGLGDVARELRECERLLAAQDGAAAVRPRPAAVPAIGVPPSLVESGAKSLLYSQPPDLTRESDDSDIQTATTSSMLLDSAEATRELARITGLNVESTQEMQMRVGSAPQPPSGESPAPHAGPGWRRRDWMLVGGATLLGLAIGAFLPRDRPR